MFSTRIAAGFFALAILAFSSTHATIVLTSPIASTVCVGGNVCTVSWTDDGTAPTADDFGATRLGLFVGTADQQVLVHQLERIRDLSSTTTIDVPIDVTYGPDGAFYMIGFVSTGGQTDAGDALQVFSDPFTLAGMSGQLSARAAAAVAGQVASSATAASTAAIVPSSSSVSEQVSSSQSSSATQATTTTSAGFPAQTLSRNVFADSGAEHHTAKWGGALLACLMTLFLA